MNKLEKAKQEIKSEFSETELRNIFAKRLDDELFDSIGKIILPDKKQRKIQQTAPYLLTWTGFEELCGVNEKYR